MKKIPLVLLAATLIAITIKERKKVQLAKEGAGCAGRRGSSATQLNTKAAGRFRVGRYATLKRSSTFLRTSPSEPTTPHPQAWIPTTP